MTKVIAVADLGVTTTSATSPFEVLVGQSSPVDCVVPIVINVRPGGLPDSINLNTVATLAALTTRAGAYGLPVPFDASRIDVSRTRWGLRSNLFDTARARAARPRGTTSCTSRTPTISTNGPRTATWTASCTSSRGRPVSR
ncbi:hypothetical protein QI633_10770 [Nocardioides sp. QY071]|uniref:hypothetical protein n=1 Tax=Nocardioides sp. QY071 TaxID=3044187 RepID=UPI00249BCD03|nr:hypothetical protein [Nocardioides sp. QY071]WGY04231.1 hypothetical protein QI633_10770 [Nocardioides sp. QY071]